MSARILLADDHPVVRQGLRLVLEAQPDLEVVAEAGDGLQAVQMAEVIAVDLAILDVSMPKLSGLLAAEQIARLPDGPRTLMLSMHAHPSFLFEALKAGSSGYVLKSSADRDLVDACRAALRGEPFRYPEGMDALVAAYRDGDHGPSDLAPSAVLTPREEQIVRLVADARTTNQIALELDISPRTVERHRENVLAKLGMRDRVELTRYAVRWGLIDP